MGQHKVVVDGDIWAPRVQVDRSAHICRHEALVVIVGAVKGVEEVEELLVKSSLVNVELDMQIGCTFVA